ncbi:hypothetical protein, partial [Enterococcus faecium]|uniref:hypothetical protein n=1 Tax=Enterococcus faecium TaxID=1352 RepID=UPI003877E039
EQVVFQQQALLVFPFEPFLVQQVVQLEQVQLGLVLLERLLEVQQLLVQSLLLGLLIVVLSRSG